MNRQLGWATQRIICCGRTQQGAQPCVAQRRWIHFAAPTWQASRSHCSGSASSSMKESAGRRDQLRWLQVDLHEGADRQGLLSQWQLYTCQERRSTAAHHSQSEAHRCGCQGSCSRRTCSRRAVRLAYWSIQKGRTEPYTEHAHSRSGGYFNCLRVGSCFKPQQGVAGSRGAALTSPPVRCQQNQCQSPRPAES